MQNNLHAIIVAAGSGSRMQSELPKQFLDLGGKPILQYSIEAFYHFHSKVSITIVLPAEHVDRARSLVANMDIQAQLIIGGEERFHSVLNGLNAIQDNSPDALVAIHDAVRPFISEEMIERGFNAAAEYHSALPILPVKDSMRFMDEEKLMAVDRNKYFFSLTPQTFNLQMIKKAYKMPYVKHFTDDATVFESAGHPIHTIPGDPLTFKLTEPNDLVIARAIVQAEVY